MVIMAMLYEFLDFNCDYLAMNAPFSSFKKEERKACLFDIEDIINFPSDIVPSVTFSKPESWGPSACARVPPGSQPFSFPATSRLTHLDPSYYRKLY